MQSLPFLLFSLLALVLTGPILWLARPHRFRNSGWFAALPPAVVSLWLLSQVGNVSHGQVISETYAWAPSLGLVLSLRLDGLSLLFGLIIAGIGTGIALYAHDYFDHKPEEGRFYLLLFSFMASMLGVVWADNLLLLFVFWELTSITSFLLIGFKWDDKASQEGARTAFLVTGLGALAMLAGFVLFAQWAGTYSVSELISMPDLAGLPIYPVALALILVGAFSKSAQFPFHFWLPGAMAAPTPVSAYLHSATMVKAGVYLLARLHPGLADSGLWFWSLLLIGGITMLVGAISAIRHFDLKALLAYATVSQLGILVMLLAFGSTKATIAVAVGILAHALYKGALFLVAGIVDHSTGTRDLRHLAALWRPLPVLTVVATLAGLSMAGIPPLFGFVAKETLLETTVGFAESIAQPIGWLATGATLVAGAFFVAYSLTLLWEGFFRPRPTQGNIPEVHHAPTLRFMLAPLVLTAIGTIYPFTMTWSHTPLLAGAASAIAGSELELHLAIWHGVNQVFLLSMGALAAGLLVFLIRIHVRRILDRTPSWLDGARLFEQTSEGIYAAAKATTRTVQGGTLASQASVVLTAASLFLLWALFRLDVATGITLRWEELPKLNELIVATLAIVAAITTVQARSRLTGIISIGVVGVTVTLIFIFQEAPDLALTQLLIEVLTVVLLVLVFYRIAPQKLPQYPKGALLRNLLVSAIVGLFGATLVILASGEPFAPTISDFFLLNSVPAGHGANVVNVILVDFRAYDTLGEITVLAIASLGGYALLRSARLRPLGHEPPTTDSTDETAEPAEEAGQGDRA